MTKVTRPTLDDLAEITEISRERLEILNMSQSRINGVYNRASGYQTISKCIVILGKLITYSSFLGIMLSEDSQTMNKVFLAGMAGSALWLTGVMLDRREKIREELEIEMNAESLKRYRQARDAKTAAGMLEAKP